MPLNMAMLCYYAECYYGDCHILFTFKPNVIMLSVVMLSVVAPFSRVVSSLAGKY
jgi:hypothetical protein